jgi:hypothetical protein
MGLYANLNTSDKAIVDNTTNLIRSSCGELCRIFNRIKAIADDTNATGLVTALDVTEVIPNTSALSGADDLTQAEVVALFNLLNNIRVASTAANDTAANRAKMSKACGINASIQQG